MLLPFPNVALYAPMSSNSLMDLLSRSFDAAYSTAIRYGKKGPIAEITSAFFPPQTDFEPIHFWGDAAPTVLFITYGNIAAQALAAAKQLQMQGTAVGVILCEQLSPIHVVAEHLRKYISKSVTLIAYVEEGIFKAAFPWLCLRNCINCHIKYSRRNAFLQFFLHLFHQKKEKRFGNAMVWKLRK